MQSEMFWIVLAIQLIVQFIIYWQLRFVVFSMGLTTFKVTKNVKAMAKTMLVMTFALNIAISLFVKIFTSSGAITGITNLFASAILGVIMYIDINRVVNKAKKEINYEERNK